MTRRSPAQMIATLRTLSVVGFVCAPIVFVLQLTVAASTGGAIEMGRAFGQGLVGLVLVILGCLMLRAAAWLIELLGLIEEHQRREP